MPHKDPIFRSLYNKIWQERKRKICPICNNFMGHRSKLCHQCQIGRNHPKWKDGTKHNSEGYVLVSMPSHPRAEKSGYVYKHRLVMEKYLGRFLKAKEIVHHINTKNSDNRLENLILFPSQKEHMKWHVAQRRKYVSIE